MQNSLLFLCTGDFILSSTRRSRQVPDYHILFIIKQYSYQSKSLQVIFCYGSYTWFAKLLRGESIWMSYSCWYKGTRILLRSLFSVYRGCQMARVLQIRSLHSSTSWWSMRKGVRRYRTVQCIGTFAGFFGWLWDLGTVFLNCWSIRISGVKASRLQQSCNWFTRAILFTKLCHSEQAAILTEFYGLQNYLSVL
jgi:hypothetical protein